MLSIGLSEIRYRECRAGAILYGIRNIMDTGAMRLGPEIDCTTNHLKRTKRS